MLGQNEIIEKIEFPVVIDDDFDTITVTITRIPTMTHAPDPVTHDDGIEDCYIIVISNWGEEKIDYRIILARIKKIKVIDWEELEKIKDRYYTVAINIDAYVGEYEDDFICSMYSPDLDKYIVLFFEQIA